MTRERAWPRGGGGRFKRTLMKRILKPEPFGAR
jgi:hypothetical protein